MRLQTGTPTRTGLHRCWPAHPTQTPYGASLSFDTVAHLRLPLDTPSRVKARAEPRALVTSVAGSPRQGPGPGLSPPVCGPCHSHQSRAAFGVTLIAIALG